jgi:arylformamidase
MRIWDISVTLKSEMPIYPGDTEFSLEKTLCVERGDVCTLSKLVLGAHTGTHLDAPYHFIAGGQKVHELELHRLIGPAYVTDLRGHALITAESLENARIPACQRLLLKTDNGRLWSNPQFQADFVYLTGEAADWILQRGIDLVGIDYLSVEQFNAPVPVAHLKLLGAGLIIVESLYLNEVPPGEYELIALPLKIESAEGSPVRAVLMER